MRETFTVAFVCTGNRFRSPIAAAVFEAATVGEAVRVHSLGTLQLNGAPALPEAVRACSLRGLDLSSHRSRKLRDRDLADVDLTVGFEPTHLARAVIEGGALPERAFLLTELVELLESSEFGDAGDPVARARRAIALAGERRAERWNPVWISDPFGGSDDQFERTAAEVHDLSVRLAVLLFGRQGREDGG